MKWVAIVFLAGVLLFIAGRKDNPVKQRQDNESEGKEEYDENQ